MVQLGGEIQLSVRGVLVSFDMEEGGSSPKLAAEIPDSSEDIVLYLGSACPWKGEGGFAYGLKTVAVDREPDRDGGVNLLDGENYKKNTVEAAQFAAIRIVESGYYRERAKA